MGDVSEKGSLGYLSIVSIGIGGMVGGGIFAVLGLAVQLAKGGTPIAFAIAGMVALATSYSYAKLSVRYPASGGTVEFLNQAFGTGLITGGLNILLWLSYIVMLSLYAYAFGSYGASLFSGVAQGIVKHALITGIILTFTALNILGSRAVGEAEEWIVVLKISILLLFIIAGIWSVDFQRLKPSEWADPLRLFAGGMIIFLAYEGFELIANTAGDAKNPQKTIPLAYYSAVCFVMILYVLVSLVTVGNLSFDEIVSAKDYALAASAKPFLGSYGFVLIAIAALLSTSSAINATLYGASRITYTIAKEGELPEILEEKIWNRPIEGLIITSALTLIIANLFDLSSIAMMGSAGFLIIFAAVNTANLRLHDETGSKRWIAFSGLALCSFAFSGLVWQIAKTSPNKLLILVFMAGSAFTIEAIYRKFTGRVIKPQIREEGIEMTSIESSKNKAR